MYGIAYVFQVTASGQDRKGAVGYLDACKFRHDAKQQPGGKPGTVGTDQHGKHQIIDSYIASLRVMRSLPPQKQRTRAARGEQESRKPGRKA